MLNSEAIRNIEQIYQSKDLDLPIILDFDSPDLCILAHKLVLLYLRSSNINLGDVHFYVRNPLDKEYVRLFESLNLTLNDNKKEINNKKEILKEKMRGLFISGMKIWLNKEEKISQSEGIWNYLIESKVNLFEYRTENYCSSFKHGLFAIFTKNVCITCNFPKFMLKDEKGNLHRDDGAAIEFNNGFGFYLVHGVLFEKELYDSIYIKRTITPKEIIFLDNVEQRVCAIDFFGKDKMIKELNAKKMDEWYGESQITKMPIYNELYEFKIGLRNIRFVKVEDYSTHKITILGVPSIKETETVMGAIAWTFGLPESQYRPLIES